MKKLLIAAFWVLSAAHLSGIAFSSEIITQLTKPALIPTLAGWFWLGTIEQRVKVRPLFLLGLLFSTAGDIFLMYQGSNFFLLGLSSFLTAHLFYIIAFYNFPNFRRGLAVSNPATVAPVIIFLGIFLAIVYPKVPDHLGVPVLIYCLVIASMVISAINLFQRISTQAAKTILAGAVLFLISDSILACEKFKILSADYAILLRLSVMTTYISGQYFLAGGVVKALNFNQSE